MHRYTLYLCTHIHLHTCILSLYMYASTPTNPNACTYTIVTHTYTHTLTHSYMYIIFMHAYTSTHVLAYTYMHSHIHMPTHIYTHIYTYTYRHTHTRALSQFLSCCYSRTSDQNSLLKKKKQLGKERLTWLILLGHSPPLWEVRAETEAEITEEHCLWAHSLACSASFLTQAGPPA